MLACGDVEPNPGPRSRSLPVAPRGSQELLTHDVTAGTAQRYNAAFAEFDRYLRAKGTDAITLVSQNGAENLVVHGIGYLRYLFTSNQLTSFGANTFAASLRRFFLLATSLGGAVPDVRNLMRPLWRAVRSYHLAVPPEFRTPVPIQVALALAVWAWLAGHRRFALCVLLGFHCFLRPDEYRRLLIEDCITFDANFSPYPNLAGAVLIREPKTRRHATHAPAQHVLLTDMHLGRFLRWALSDSQARGPLWTQSESHFRLLWDRGLLAVGASELQLLPAGLRGGGASHHYLLYQDVTTLRRRGRWNNLATVDRYIQEGVVHMLAYRLSPITLQLAAFSSLIFTVSDNPPPPLSTDLT